MARAKKRSKLILILGGAASGKSDVALQMATEGFKRVPRPVFVATGEGLDDEMVDKIARHRRSRPSEWVTAEVPVDLTGWIEKHGREHEVIVVDCLTMWLSNQFGRGSQDFQIMEDISKFLRAVRDTTARVVLVGNELGMGLVPVDALSRRFRELSGAVNRLVAREADEAYLVVSGLSVRLK